MTVTHTYKNTNNNDVDKAPFPFLEKRKPYQHYEQTFQVQQIHFYINEDVVEPELYTDMIYRMQCASQHDTIYIHLNTPGGRLDTGVQIINAMRNSQAHVVTILEGTAHSLGTIILLSGREIQINDDCMIMFHNFRGGVIGKGNELTSELDATVKWFSELAKNVYTPFLTDDELNRLLKGEDIWMRSAEIRKRLNNMMKEEQAKETAKENAKSKKKDSTK